MKDEKQSRTGALRDKNGRFVKKDGAPAQKPRKKKAPAKASERKSAEIWKKIGYTALALVLIAILAFAGLGIYSLTRKSGKSGTALAVLHDGTMYTSSADGILVRSGDEFVIDSLTDDGAFSVRVYARQVAYGSKEDFAFKIGEEDYHWSDVGGRDITRGFTLTTTQKGFKISYESAEDIISKAFGYVGIDGDADLTGVLFTLVISNERSEIELGFSVCITGISLRLSWGRIIF